METTNIEKPKPSLEQIPANQWLVDELCAQGKISATARDFALNRLYPRSWALWAYRLLLVLGCSLILVGCVYFFAYNWANIPPFVKLFSLQGLIVACIGGAWFFSLQRFSGQLSLLSAGVFVGIFMAVFGQIYQTGADSYQLFMMWSALTLVWTLLSNFAVQWIFWIIITNVFLVLWWNQAISPEPALYFMIYGYLILFNGLMLFLREYFLETKAYVWLEMRWIRLILLIILLVLIFVSLGNFIMGEDMNTRSIKFSAWLSALSLAMIYAVYRYKFPDIHALTCVALCVCLLGELTLYKMIGEPLWEQTGNEVVALFWMSLITIGIFVFAIVYLRKMTQVMGVKNV